MSWSLPPPPPDAVPAAGLPGRGDVLEVRGGGGLLLACVLLNTQRVPLALVAVAGACGVPQGMASALVSLAVVSRDANV